MDGDAAHSNLKYDESLQADDYKIITRLKGELTTGTTNYKQNSSVTITMENLKAATEGVANGTYPDLATAKAATNTVVTKTSLLMARLQINQWASNNNITGDITIASNTVYTLNDAKFVSASQKDVAVRNLTVSKTITSGDATKDFNFTVKLTDAADAPLTGSYKYTGDKTGTLTLNAQGEASFTLKHGQSITITDIPKGSKYTVTEAGGGTGWSITAPAGGSAAGTLDDHKSAAFTNAYAPIADDITVPAVTKTISDRQPVTPTTFTYTLRAGDLTFPMPTGSTGGVKTITSSGGTLNAQFGDITFAEEGIYTYTITEKAESATGYTYDRTKYTWTVTVVDKNGNLEATGALESDAQGAANPVTQAAFDNAYNPTAHPYVVPTVTKSITGGHNPDTDQTFSYTLTQTVGADTMMPAGSAGRTKTINVVGANTAIFGEIDYTGCLGTAYEYTITEIIPAQQPHGYTYNPTNTSYHIAVNIEDRGGVLYVHPVVTKVVNGVDQADVNPATMFENSYAPDADTYNPLVSKTVTGNARPAEKTFDFELTRITAGAPLPAGATGDTATVQITGGGNANFGNITYERAGEYKYSITEKAPATADVGYTYDTTRYILTVTVTDTAGVLSAVGEIVEIGDTTPTTARFNNTYAPLPATLLPPLQVTKTITGVAMTAAHEFTFTLELTDGSSSGVTMPTPTSVKTAEISTGSSAPSLFNSVIFTAAGDYTFTVTETNSGMEGITYAEPQTVHVKVTDNNGTLVAQYVDAAGAAVTDGEKLTFTNNYTPTPATLTNTDFDIVKRVAGDTLAQAKAFSFNIALTNGDATAVTMPNPATVTTAAIKTGSAAPVSFSDITFKAVGTYTFTVTETASAIDGMTDAPPQTVTVEVTDNGGALAARITNPAAGGHLTCVNTYDMPRGDLVIRKTVTGTGAPTTDTFSFIVTFGDGGTYDGVVSGSTVTLRAGETRTISGIPQGVTYKVVEAEKENYTPTPANRTVEGAIGAAPSTAAFSNAYEQPPVGSFTLSKTVTGTGAPKADEFTFTVTFSDGGSYNYTGSKAGTIASGGTITLKGGESVAVADIPIGVTYKVVEAEKANYTPNPSTRTINGTISATDGTAAFVNAYASPVNPPVDPPVETGSLTVKKTVSGDLGDKEKDFVFTVKFNADGSYKYTGSKTGTIASGGSITLKHGESVTIALPARTKYTVTESGNAGYKVTSTGTAGVIAAASTVTAAFTNTKSSEPDAGGGGTSQNPAEPGQPSATPSVPKTGDDGASPIWFVLMGVSLAGIAGLLIIYIAANRKRRRKHNA